MINVAVVDEYTGDRTYVVCHKINGTNNYKFIVSYSGDVPNYEGTIYNHEGDATDLVGRILYGRPVHRED